MTKQQIREDLEQLKQTKEQCEAFIRGYKEGLRQIQFKIDALNEMLEREQA